ncbi:MULTISPECIES: amidohydrolase family protein [Microbacterium]|uniref:Amidohydrolase-related domain-containing protein n=1 Tax=Microbacterium wangchenii TaxID=2541726 RepID=A0ABX5SVF1_9MICO|nr:MULTISPECIES: amidohydrolase family protein [Microbacterium]MCK6065864.1 amidohydrolase family protein [Microbacterium sp. EYE_512]QBR90168.1 hypothetical protein E4K62_16670 [Microbacterium wangchenii]TFV85021.1 hypothetical protein E4V99_08310 [Microbacterium sp. dk485]TXK11816.1 amidohydrolase family protein [Microbacterium wangchenii]
MRPRHDAHIHLFETGYRGSARVGAELAEYERLRDLHGLDRALVVGYEGETRFSGNNSYILRLARDRAWVVPLVYLHPRATTMDVEDAWRRGAAGFSLYLSGQDISALRPAVLQALDERRALLSVNATPSALRSLASVLACVPNATVLLSHLGLPAHPEWGGLEDWAKAIEALAHHPGVLMKLSGLYAIDPHPPHIGAASALEIALSLFGASRLVWGSDYSPGLEVVGTTELFDVPGWLATALTSDGLELVTTANLHLLLTQRSSEPRGHVAR